MGTQFRLFDPRSRIWLVIGFALTLWIATYLGKFLPLFATQHRLFVSTCAVVVACLICAWVIFQLTTNRHIQKVMFVLGISAASVIGLVNGASAWWAVDTPLEGPCAGVVTVMQDPEIAGRGVVTVVKMQGIRYRVMAYGMSQRRVLNRLMGEQMYLEGTCGRIDGRYADWDRQRHILGTIAVDHVSEEFSYGSPLYRSANRLRRHIVGNVDQMSPSERALFAGLVMGDDREQPRSMVDSFRATGLSHLCAVSGQNVAYVLAVAGVFLRSRRTAMRLVLTGVVLLWFVVLTRAEPSVVRAAVMAGIVACAFAWGREANTKEVLGVTAIAMLCIDPMMARSVGFMLSTGATAGLAWLLPVTTRMMGTNAIAKIIAATLAAHLGTALISLSFFGSLPVVALFTNPIAVPVASFVMLVGLPVSLVSSVLPDVMQDALTFCLAIPVRLLWRIAIVGDAMSPRGLANALCWVAVGWWCVRRFRSADVQSELLH